MIAVALVSLATLTACGTPAHSSASATPDSSLTASSYPRIAVVQDHKAKNDRWWRYDYPSFAAADDSSATAAIATDLNLQVSADRTAFEARSGTDCHNEVLPDEKCAFNITIAQQYSSERVVVIMLSTYLMLAGGAHGDAALRTYAYDAKTGDPISLTDEFRDGTLDRFREAILNKVPEQVGAFGDTMWSKQEVRDVLYGPDAFLAWAVDDYGISVQFNSYLLGPYSSGQPTIWFRWDEVESLLNPDSVLLPNI